MVDRFSFMLVVFLMAIGLLASYSLPAYLEFNKDMGQYHFVIRFALFSMIGMSLMFVLSSLNPKKWFDIIWRFLLYGSFLALIIMQIPAFSFMVPDINGAKRWISLGFIHIAPVEFLKIGLLGFLASNLSKIAEFEDRLKNIKKELEIIIPFFIALLIASYFTLFRQSDLGQTMIIWFVFIIMWLVIGANTRVFLGVITAGIIAFFFLIFQESYRLARFLGWLYSVVPSFILPNGTTTTNFDSYRQVDEAIDAIHHGGLFGTFLGNGIIKLGFFSDVQTDFVLAGLGEEIGAVGLILIIGLFFLLIRRLLRLAKLSDNLKYKLFIIGMALIIGGQLIMNSFGEVGIIPIKGITVPFLSYGGSSLISLSIGMGMVLMLSKRSSL